MAKLTRSNDWGFPRWRAYEKGREAARIRLCDREGCDLAGDRPAPKAPNRPERWYFCEAHAAEYNRGWDYFAGLSPEEAARLAVMLPRPKFYDRNRGSEYLARRAETIQRYMGDAQIP